MWFHLRFGREFLSNWSIERPGHLGVYDSAQWVPTQWLSQEGMALLEGRFGIGTLLWAVGALQMVLLISVYAACRTLSSPLPAVIATALALMATSPGLSARPQVLSYLFVVLTTAAWLATARDGRPRYWVIALAWVWPMLHGMWPVGLSISAVAVLGLTLQRELSARSLMRLATIPLLSCLVAVLNPLGTALVQGLVEVSSRTSYFAEWGPPDFTAPAAGVLAVMFAFVLVAGFRSDPVPWVHAALAALALGWGLYSLRTTPVSALILAPLVGSALQPLVPRAGRMNRSEWVSIVAMGVASVTASAVVLSLRTSERVVPAWVDDRLSAMPAGARVLNDWDSGSYFLFRHPELDLMMHGYGDVFTDDEIARNATLTRLEPGWDKRVAALEPDAALVDPNSSIAYSLEYQLGWTTLQADDDFAILIPPDQP